MERRDFLKAAAVASVATAGCLDGSESDAGTETTVLSDTVVTVHMSPNCDCCAEYADYIADTTGAEVERNTDTNRDGFGIPAELRGCHTMEAEVDGRDRVVEGHVPLEAIERLAESDVTTVALPGMPLGSPGMGGQKQEEFTVYEVMEDGSYEVFAEV